MKPGILKLTITRGQSNFSILFICVTCEEKGSYGVISVGQLSFDCRSYCGRSHRMQGGKSHDYRDVIVFEKLCFRMF